MTYKERYEIEHAEEIKRANIISAILTIVTAVLMVISMFSTLVGLIWYADSSSVISAVFTLISFMVLMVTGLIAETYWEDND